VRNGLLEPADVEPLLREFARRISEDGQRATVRVVGGAAIALLNPDRRLTQDIDVAIHPSGSWSHVAAAMAAEHGLAPDWINDAVAARLPFVGREEWHELVRHGEVAVLVASPRLLLAMKLFANRGVRDTDDIHFLLDACGVESLEKAQEIYEEYHAQELLSASAELRVRNWIRSRRGGADSPGETDSRQ
jgi:hypothetical protein